MHLTSDPTPALLRLQGFAAPAFVEFDHVQIGDGVSRFLILSNPSDQSVRVIIDPVNEPTLTFSPTEIDINGNGQEKIEFIWRPVEGTATGKNYRVPVTIRMSGGRQRFKAIMTGTAIGFPLKSSKRKGRFKYALECSEIDENVPRNGTQSIAWNAQFKKQTLVKKSEISIAKKEIPIPVISPSKIAPYFLKVNLDQDTETDICFDEENCKDQVEIVIEDRRPKGGIAFETDLKTDFIKAPKIPRNKAKIDKIAFMKPSLQKKAGNPLATKTRGLLLTPTKKKMKAPAPTSYRHQQFYDENWATKQENAFQIWLNFYFQRKAAPHAFMIEEDASVCCYQTMKEFSAHAQLFQKAIYCYRSKAVQTILCRIEEAICAGHMKIRQDINMLIDLGLRDRFVNLLFSYNQSWLKLALETVYGQLLPASACLRHFVQTRILSNSELDDEHTYLRTPQGQPFFDQTHKSAMESFVLKKVLQIVLFLDIAKSQLVFPDSPCLFQIGHIKSTKDLLYEFASLFMASQGDIVKAIMQFCQYECSACQTSLDEYDYQVGDLIQDLKDGVRLCSLTGQSALSHQILLPAINKSRKKHNVVLALQEFVRQGVPMIQCTAEDVVDGNKHRVLVLLWNILSHLIIPDLIDLPLLFNEIRLIRHRHHNPVICDFYADNRSFQLLLKWCQSICHQFQVKISNFTASFCDGRAFAFIIHYYYPQLISLSDIHQSTRTLQDHLKERQGIPDIDDLSDGSWMQFLHLQASQDQVTRALEGERHNWRTVANAVGELGAIPFLFPDLGRNTKQVAILDERAVIVFVCHLCSRLLALSKESHAARALQRRWREKKRQRLQLLTPTAVETISWSLLSCYYNRAAVGRISSVNLIQSAFQHYQQRKHVFHISRSITLLQLHLRSYCQQAAALRLQSALKALQAAHIFSQYHHQRDYYSARIIQRQFRDYRRSRSARIIQSFFSAISYSQRLFTAYTLRRHYSCKRLQHCIQRYHAQCNRRRIQVSLSIGSAFATIQAVHHFNRVLDFTRQNAAKSIQISFRRYQIRRRSSALLIQQQFRHYRRSRSARVLQGFLSAISTSKRLFIAIALRRHYSSKRLQRCMKRYRSCCVTRRTAATLSIGSAFAAFNAVNRFSRILALTQHNASKSIQSCFRKYQFRRLCNVRLIQRRFRLYRRSRCARLLQAGFSAVSSCRRLSTAIVLRRHYSCKKLQRSMQRYHAQCIHNRTELSLSIGSGIAAFQAVIRFGRVLGLTRENAAKCIGKNFRQYWIKREEKRLMASEILQFSIRTALSSISFQKLHTLRRSSSAFFIQTYYRCYRADLLEKRTNASIAIQSAAASFRTLIAFQKMHHYRYSRAAKCIQSNLHQFLLRLHLRRINSACLIQTTLSSYYERRSFEKRLHSRKMNSARLIQSCYKSHQERVISRKKAAFLLLDVFQSIQSSRQIQVILLQKKLDAVHLIQKNFRHWIAFHLDSLRSIQAAFAALSTSQKSIRFICVRRYSSCIKLQRSIRCFLRQSKQYRLEQKTKSAMEIQAGFRGVLACLEADRYGNSVIRIQSMWRGTMQRLKASRKVRQARKRIQDASSRWAPELTIGYRLKQALDVLLSGSKLSALTHACRMLDEVTRSLPGCAVDAVQHNAIPVLFALMRGLNRSKPHLELLGYALSILVTFSTNPTVKMAVYQGESCVDVMLELLQTQRENSDLFIKTANLLCSGCESPEFLASLQAAAKRISSIHALLSRKLEMNIRYHHPGSGPHTKQIQFLEKSVKAVENLQHLIR